MLSLWNMSKHDKGCNQGAHRAGGTDQLEGLVDGSPPVGVRRARGAAQETADSDRRAGALKAAMRSKAVKAPEPPPTHLSHLHPPPLAL